MHTPIDRSITYEYTEFMSSHAHECMDVCTMQLVLLCSSCKVPHGSYTLRLRHWHAFDMHVHRQCYIRTLEIDSSCQQWHIDRSADTHTRFWHHFAGKGYIGPDRSRPNTKGAWKEAQVPQARGKAPSRLKSWRRCRTGRARRGPPRHAATP